MHLQKRIDAFLEGVAGKLGSIDEAELEGHRAALIAAKLQKDPRPWRRSRPQLGADLQQKVPRALLCLNSPQLRRSESARS